MHVCLQSFVHFTSAHTHAMCVPTCMTLFCCHYCYHHFLPKVLCCRLYDLLNPSSSLTASMREICWRVCWDGPTWCGGVACFSSHAANCETNSLCTQLNYYCGKPESGGQRRCSHCRYMTRAREHRAAELGALDFFFEQKRHILSKGEPKCYHSNEPPLTKKPTQYHAASRLH